MSKPLSTMEKHKQSLLKISGVISVGIGFKYTGGIITNQMSVIVGVVKKLPRQEVPHGEMIPPFLDDCPTDVIEMGRIKALGHSSLCH